MNCASLHPLYKYHPLDNEMRNRSLMNFFKICLLTTTMLLPEGADETAKAIATAYAANLGGPSFGTIKFRLLNGEASDPNAARRGVLTDIAVAEGLYAFDGPQGLYRCQFPLDAMVSHRTELDNGGWMTRLNSSERAITNGELSLHDLVAENRDGDSETHTAQIEPGVEAYARAIGLPIAPCVPQRRGLALDQMIHQALGRENHWRLVSVEQGVSLDNAETVRLTLEQEESESPSTRLQFWVDLEHGAVPRRIRNVTFFKDSETQNINDSYFDDVRLVDGRCWLPFRMTQYSVNDRYTRQYVIDSANFKERPAKSMFRLKFPKAIPMVNAAPKPPLRYAPRKVWDLSDLPSPSSKETKQLVVQAPKPDPRLAMPPGNPIPAWRRWRPWMLLVLGNVLLALGVIILWWRKRGREKEAKKGA